MSRTILNRLTKLETAARDRDLPTLDGVPWSKLSDESRRQLWIRSLTDAELDAIIDRMQGEEAGA